MRPGDSLRLKIHVGGTRPSASRPDRGFVEIRLELRSDRDEIVMTQSFTLIVQRRDAVQSAPGTRPEPDRGSVAIVAPTGEADLMLTTFYDDVSIGHESTFGAQLFTPELIIGFAALYDPQYFHLDAEAARHSHFGGLCASGWQTAAFWMKHYLAARTRSTEARNAAGLPAAVGGPSPGFTDMKWLRPVRAGDSVRYGLRITGKRRAGRSGWGMVNTLNTGHAADGALVFSFHGRLLWPIAPTAVA